MQKAQKAKESLMQFKYTGYMPTLSLETALEILW